MNKKPMISKIPPSANTDAPTAVTGVSGPAKPPASKTWAGLRKRHDRPGLNGIVMVERTRETGARTETETRVHITSLADPAGKPGPVIRRHRATENSLHRVMDMVLRDDECRISTGHAPANFTTVKHVAHNRMRRSPAKDSMRLKRKVAACNDDVRVSLIAQ